MPSYNATLCKKKINLKAHAVSSLYVATKNATNSETFWIWLGKSTELRES